MLSWLTQSSTRASVVAVATAVVAQPLLPAGSGANALKLHLLMRRVSTLPKPTGEHEEVKKETFTFSVSAQSPRSTAAMLQINRPLRNLARSVDVVKTRLDKHIEKFNDAYEQAMKDPKKLADVLELTYVNPMMVLKNVFTKVWTTSSSKNLVLDLIRRTQVEGDGDEVEGSEERIYEFLGEAHFSDGAKRHSELQSLDSLKRAIRAGQFYPQETTRITGEEHGSVTKESKKVGWPALDDVDVREIVLIEKISSYLKEKEEEQE